MDVARRIHDLLWVVRELRRGHEARAMQRVNGLPKNLRQLPGLPLADVCLALAERIGTVAIDSRAADACIRFYGLGRLPEDVGAICATLPQTQDRRERLHSRRVEQLIRQAENELATDLARTPLILAPTADNAAAPKKVLPLFSPWLQQRVLLWAWADVPDGDHRSATALLLFEQDAGLRPPIAGPMHREARRRLRQRAQAILDVAAQRYARACSGERPDPIQADQSAELLLGPRQLALVGSFADVLDPILRSSANWHSPDLEALVAASRYAHQLVQEGSANAPAVLGLLRDTIARIPRAVPVGVTTKVLASAVVLARSRDDPAGFPAGWEGLRITREYLAGASDSSETRRVTANALRVLQELAELYDRLRLPVPALRTLAQAYQLLDERGDPDAEEEPDGWHQQLLFSQGIIQRRAAQGTRRPLGWLAAAHAAEARSAHLVWEHDLLPREWGLSAEAILAETTIDQVECHIGADDKSAASQAAARAREVIERNRAGWHRHGTPRIVVGRSARFTTARAACRLALLQRDVDVYWHEREYLRTEAGSWMLPCDVEGLEALETQAEPLGVPRLRLSERGPRCHERTGQRSWRRLT